MKEMDDLEAKKEKARKLAWATYLDLLQDGDIDPKVRREAAKDVLESVGDLTRKPQVVDAKQFILNIDPKYLSEAAQAIRSLMGGVDDRKRLDIRLDEDRPTED